MESHKIVQDRLSELRSAQQTDCDEYKQLTDVEYYIKQIADYIKNGSWARPATRAKYLYWIKCNYDYALTAKAYRTDPKCIRVLVSRSEARLRGLLERPYNMIISGEACEGWIDFCISTGSVDYYKLYCLPAKTAFPEMADLNSCHYYPLDDCKQEINFLASHNIYAIQRKVKALDNNKLAYLIALADSDDPALHKERCRLMEKII